jgi:hypothetical protein
VGQRARLYAAEDVLIGPVDWYASLEAAQFDIDRFLRTKWWRDRSEVRFVTLRYPAKSTGATKLDMSHWEISFRPKSLCDLNVAHEMTHILVGVSIGTTPAAHERDHNRVFAGAELEVLKRFVSAEVAEKLRAEFKEAGVKWEGFD